MAGELSKELAAYRARFDNLIAVHEGKFALLHGDQLLGVFDSQMDAITRGYKELGNVPFLVKHISRLEVPLSFVSNCLAV